MLNRYLIFSFIICLMISTLHAQSEQNSKGTEMSEEEKEIRRILQLPVPGEEQDSESDETGEDKASESLTKEEAKEALNQMRAQLSSQSRWFQNHQLEASLGYRRNVLKSHDGSVDSSYISGNWESSLTWLRNRIPVLTLYAMAEHREFIGEDDLPGEDFVLLYNNISAGKDNSRLIKTETTAFYLRQVMDNPLQEGAPSLLTLFNVRVRSGLQLKAEDHKFFAALQYYREQYEDEDLDYTGIGLFFRWTWQFHDRWDLRTDLEYAPRHFDDRLARQPSGLPLRNTRLKLDQATASTILTWEPALEWFTEYNTTVKVRREWSQDSAYDENTWVKWAHEAEFSLGNFSILPGIEGSYREYDRRQVSFQNPDTQYRWRWNTSLEMGYTFSESTNMKLIYEFDDARSNRISSDYHHDDLQFMFTHSF